MFRFSWSGVLVVAVVLGASLLALAYSCMEMRGVGQTNFRVVFDRPLAPGTRVLATPLWDRSHLRIVMEQPDNREWIWQEVAQADGRTTLGITQYVSGGRCTGTTIRRPEVLLFVAESPDGRRAFGTAEVPKQGGRVGRLRLVRGGAVTHDGILPANTLPFHAVYDPLWNLIEGTALEKPVGQYWGWRSSSSTPAWSSFGAIGSSSRRSRHHPRSKRTQQQS